MLNFCRCALAVLIFLCSTFFSSHAQTSNPCGVVASIFPATKDSVVPPNTAVMFSSASTNATSFKWFVNGSQFTFSNSPDFYYGITPGVHKISLVASNGTCSDTMTVVYFSAGTPYNLDSLLLSSYGTSRYNEEGRFIDKTPDGGFIAGGIQYLWGACGQPGILLKLRDKGCIDWSKRFLSPFYCNNTEITSLYASVDTNYYAQILNSEIYRLDKDGNIKWGYRYELNKQGVIGVSVIGGDSQGDVYLVSGVYNNGMSVTKLNKNGGITWNKLYQLSHWENSNDGSQTEYLIPSGMVEFKGKLFISGNAYSKVSGYFSFITRLDAVTGAKEWQYGYVDPEFPTAMGFTHLTTYDTLLMASSFAQGQMVTLIDQQGNLRKSIKAKFQDSYNPLAARAGADSAGHIYLMHWTTQALPLQPYYQYYTNFAKIDTSLNKYWGLGFSNYSRTYFTDAVVSKNGYLGSVGTDYGYVTDAVFASRDFRFMQVDTVTARQYCFSSGTGYTLSTKTLSRVNYNYLIDSSLSITAEPGSGYTVEDAFLESRYTCPDYIDSCSYLKLSGPVNLCNLNDTYIFRVHRNKKCATVPQWKLAAGMTIVSQTDSTLSVKFAAFGQYRLSAEMGTCLPVKDSLIITVQSKSRPLDLGADTSICAGTTIPLRAAKDFFSYLWSDGSHDSLLTVTQPGLYWVEAIDSCGNVQRDSIVINGDSPVISLGPDRIKCNSDTVHLNAPTGYISYSWTNNYNIISETNVPDVIVNPLLDTAYYLKAEKLPGCFAYDTIRVTVNTSLPLQLGQDQSFCEGDSALFIAAAGFDQYNWSNGATGQQLTAYDMGTFSLVGTAVNGCKSYDTVKVLNVWPNPIVTLDNNPELCIGGSRILDAGNFVSYLWQNGATSSSITINELGTYTVAVTDDKGCKGSDTIYVTRLLPTPATFLPKDTAVCSYGSLLLIANESFVKYNWNTGASSASLNVTTPGWYWLDATDQKGCTGRDSVMVKRKECLLGFHIPKGFTPNGDGLNELFRPVIGGVIKQYEFTIYDRWGKPIFITRDPLKGWDGNTGGIQRDSNVFVWTCTFQLEGEPIRVEKGTVILIR